MREKLLDLMKNEGLKPSQLAEMLEINPAGISHILAGRNKPGFDLLQKILRRFPRINPDWLLLDSAQMYRDDNSAGTTGSAAVPATPVGRVDTSDDLFSRNPAQGIPGAIPNAADTSASRQQDVPATAAMSAAAIANALNAAGKVAAVKRVVVLYDDQTFDSYTPAKR